MGHPRSSRVITPTSPRFSFFCRTGRATIGVVLLVLAGGAGPRGRDGQTASDESEPRPVVKTLQSSMSVPEGLLLVYQVETVDSTETEPVFVARWIDDATGTSYLFERFFFTNADRGHVMLAVDRDFGTDLDEVATHIVDLNRAVDEAYAEPEDATGWILYSRRT